MTRDNVLLDGLGLVVSRLEVLREWVRAFYYEVLLAGHACPACGGRLVMTGSGQASCEACRSSLDPTVAFQQSPCCGARLVFRRAHYACLHCGAPVPSRFLFDEKLFDATYFAGRMQESRERRRREIEELRRRVAESRSGEFVVSDVPELESIPGLADALDSLVETAVSLDKSGFGDDDPFVMEAYREVIWRGVHEDAVLFSQLPVLNGDPRRDRARRFMTLVFMEQEREVDLAQYGNDVLVMRHEADAEGC